MGGVEGREGKLCNYILIKNLQVLNEKRENRRKKKNN